MGDVRGWLRASTRDWHTRVDAAYARFTLAERASYRDFLTAHARALIPLEDWIDGARLLPDWRGRSAAVADDLATLAAPPPPCPRIAWPDNEAARWGALYVLEGSRMGAAVLARAVGPDLPTGYLNASAPPGLWRNLVQALERAAASGGPLWREQALTGAMRAFALFDSAAREAHAAHG